MPHNEKRFEAVQWYSSTHWTNYHEIFLQLNTALRMEAFSSVVLLLPSTSSRWKQQPGGGGNHFHSHSIPHKAHGIQIQWDYAKRRLTLLWATKDGKRDIWHERALSVVCGVRKKAVLCCFVLWPWVWSHFPFLSTWMSKGVAVQTLLHVSLSEWEKKWIGFCDLCTPSLW